MYWLLAPLALTALGTSVLVVRSRYTPGSGRGSDPVSEHRKLLDALARAHPPIMTPVNAVGDLPSQDSPKSGS